jgi:hypothetical protein
MMAAFRRLTTNPIRKKKLYKLLYVIDHVEKPTEN